MSAKILSNWTEGQKRGAGVLAFFVLAGSVFSIVIGELRERIDWVWRSISDPISRSGVPEILLFVVSVLLVCTLLVAFISLASLFMVWWERKVSAHMQSRLGPMFAGGWHGWAQTIADTIKLFLKQDVVPENASPWVHGLAPVVAFVPSFLCFAALPFGEGLVAADLDIGLLYIFAVSGISVLGIVMAVWGSGNKYSLLGGMRSAAQSVSYEIPRLLSVVPVIMLVGSLKLTDIAAFQSGFWSLGGVPLLPRWFIFYPFIGQIAFLIYLISSVAEANRTPFDLPEAESELVAGFHTEYSGLKFSFFFLAEYTYIFLAGGIGAMLFLGGGNGPILPSWVWFLLKSFFLVFLFIWFRWTFPRLRVDRLMELCWKVLLPWSFVNILATGFVEVVR